MYDENVAIYRITLLQLFLSSTSKRNFTLVKNDKSFNDLRTVKYLKYSTVTLY